MFKTILQFTLIFLIVGIIVAFSNSNDHVSKYTESTPNGMPKTVSEALLMIGADKPNHYIKKVNADSARMGEEIVRYGNLLDGSNKRISKYFVCTDCHNVQLETANPADESPEAVLEYGMKNGVPFLPASTFYGMYNKEHWYNDDYFKKYGDLVKPTRDSLYNAIQLCATQCSQGRKMDHWEVRAILHYYKSLELQISDLKFDEKELSKFSKLLSMDKKGAAKLLKEKYTQVNHAHFGSSDIPVVEGYEPNADNGKYIFNKGCLHCHDSETGITNFTMSDDKLSLAFLHRKKNKYNHYAVPHITRYGTYAFSGRKQYMPMYSFEKMSEKQMLDLLFYIKVGSGN
jgi:mono/diheme cytochrome c family protein